MSTGEVFAVFASGVAVATSIGSVAIALTALLRDRPHLRVESSFGFVMPSSEGAIVITVINNGRHTEVVSSLGFQTSDERQMLMIGPEGFPSGQLPWRLQPNESNMAIIPRDVLLRRWKEGRLGKMTRVFARTQSGRLYRNRPNKAVAESVRS